MSDAPAYRFAGFISYSQKDKRWATRIHKALEAYRLPVGVADDASPNRRLGRFFRDDEELAGAPSLGAALTGALDDSRTLIVICSPNSARSKWVDAEIAHFKSRGPDGRVLAVIVAGKPDTDDPEQMCFAPSMLRKVNTDGELTDEPDEPLAPDVAKDSFDRIVARLVAGIVGVEFDSLWQRERRRQRRRRIVTGLAASMLLAAAAGGTFMVLEEERQRLAQESINRAAESQAAADEGRMDDALELALSALRESPGANDRPLTGAADAALRRVMGGNGALGVLARFEQGVDALHPLDADRLAARLADGSMVVLDAASGQTLRAFPADERLSKLGDGLLAFSSESREDLDASGALRIVHRLRVRDLGSGDTLRALEHRDDAWWLGPDPAISRDGSLVVAHPALSASAAERSDIAVWGVPAAGDGGAPEVVARTRAPFVDRDSLVRTAFTGPDSVVVLWGEARQGAAFWRFSDAEPIVLSNVGDPLACEGRLDDDEKRRDLQALSPDGALLTHARPIAGGGWCVRLWRAATGEALAPIEVDLERIGGVDALDEDTLVVAPSWRSFAPEGGLWRRGADELDVLPCTARTTSVMGPAVDERRWLMRPSRELAVCAADAAINVARGQRFDVVGVLRGHVQAVQALAYSPASGRLWSAADDGEVRAWSVDPLPQAVSLPGVALRLATWGGRVVVLQRTDEGGPGLAVFEADGEPVGRPFPVEVAGLVAEARPQGQLTLVAVPLAADAVMLVENWDCGLFGCPPGTPRRVTLIDARTGSVRWHMDDAGYGGFLAAVPAAVSVDPDRQSLVAVSREGAVAVVDVATGRAEAIAMPEGLTARQAMSVGGQLAVLASDEADEPEERHMVLLQAGSSGSLVEVSRDRAQAGRLHRARSGKRAVAFLETVPGEGRRPLYRFVFPDGVTASFVMPHADVQGESLHAALFFEDDSHVALLFSEDAVPPQRVRLPGSASDAVEAGAIEPLAPNLPSSMRDPWRIDDPAGRAVLSVDDDRLFVLPTTPGGSCKAELGETAGAAAFTPDGGLLAVSDRGEGRTQVFRTADCTRVRSESWSVRNNAAKLAFADDRHLWSLTGTGTLRLVRIEPAFEAVFERGRTLRDSLKR